MALIGLILVGWLQLHMIYDILLHTIGTSSGIYYCCIYAGSLFKVTLLLWLFFLCLLLLWDWSSGTGIQVFILSSFRSIKAFMILFLVPPYALEDDVPFFSCSKDLPPETICVLDFDSHFAFYLKD
jgi:hypothetical protein